MLGEVFPAGDQDLPVGEQARGVVRAGGVQGAGGGPGVGGRVVQDGRGAAVRVRGQAHESAGDQDVAVAEQRGAAAAALQVSQAAVEARQPGDGGGPRAGRGV
jgi:hypothetical protein